MATDFHQAGQRMRELIGILLAAPDYGLGKGLRVPQDFYLLELAPQFTINDWVCVATTPREEREFFLQLATRSPFLADAPANVLERDALLEIFCDESGSPAFQAAYLLDSPLISLNHSIWKSPHLKAPAAQMDDEGELSKFEVSLINISQERHFESHAAWIEARRQHDIQDAATLWNERGSLLKALEFCPCVESQILSVQPQTDLFAQIVDRLFDLQRVASLGKPFDKNIFRTRCSPTSPETLHHKQHGPHYHIVAADGQKKQCGWHLMLPDGHRIYFSTDYTIGHIGSHLPTVKYH